MSTLRKALPMIIDKYIVTVTGEDTFLIEHASGDYSNHGLFYYSPEETRLWHKANLAGQYPPRQLIAMDSELTNKRLYTRLINARIKELL